VVSTGHLDKDGLALKKPYLLGRATTGSLAGCCSAAGFQLGEATLVGWCSDAVCQLEECQLADQSDVLQLPPIHVELDGAAESRSTQVEVAREALQAAHSVSVQWETAEPEESAASGAAAATELEESAASGAAAAAVWPAEKSIHTPAGAAAWPAEESTHTGAGFVHVEAQEDFGQEVAAQEDFGQEVGSSCRFARTCSSSRACQQ
jgi:hypothetical protein